MQLSMGFFEEPESAQSVTPVWPTLDQTQKAEILATLARLIAKAAAAEQSAIDDVEARNE